MAAVFSSSSDAKRERVDGKLDALLRRELAPDEYERILATEVCILVTGGQREKRAHGHVILGSSHLYFSAIPVKPRLQCLLRLSDIVSTATIDDVPDFLSSKDGELTVHLTIKYKETTPTSSPKRTASPGKTWSPLATPLVKEPSRDLGELNLYILKAESVFVSYLSLHLEDVQLALADERNHITSQVLNKDSIISLASQRYQSLKTEILSAQSIETSAELYLELGKAFDCYYQLKLLYWLDNGELLRHSLKDLKRFNCSMADKFEYAAIITEVISKAFQYTLVSKSRFSLLTQNHAVTISDLTKELFDLFSIPMQDVKLSDEIASSCCGILFELSRIVQQMTWRCNSSSYSISEWCVCCESHPSFVSETGYCIPCVNRLPVAVSQ